MLAALKSWKTTAAGIIAAAGLIAQAVIEFAEAPAKLRMLAMVVDAIAVAALGILSRDNNKTSEDVGAPNVPKQIAVGGLAIDVGDAAAAKAAIQELVKAAIAVRKADGDASKGPPQ